MRFFQPWLHRWDLRPDGPARMTRTSGLLPVVWRRRPAMLKVMREPGDRAGAQVLAWYRGGGAAEVLALDGPAVLGPDLQEPTLDIAVQPDIAARRIDRIATETGTDPDRMRAWAAAYGALAAMWAHDRGDPERAAVATRVSEIALADLC